MDRVAECIMGVEAGMTNATNAIDLVTMLEIVGSPLIGVTVVMALVGFYNSNV